MEGSEYMYAAVEAGVALAGFSALVVVLRQASDSLLSESDRLIVYGLVERGLMASFLSFLPILLFGLNVPARLVWLFSSGSFVAYGVSLAVRAFKTRRNDPASFSKLASGPVFRILMSIGLLVIALQLIHALGIGLQQSVWWYLVGVTWLLVSAGYLFVFVLRSWARAA